MRRLHAATIGRVILIALCVAWAANASLAEEPAVDVPLLTVDQAVQIAIANNYSLKIASLDIGKSKWQIAEAKTNRLPAFKTYFFAAGNLNSPNFTFRQGTFGKVGGLPVLHPTPRFPSRRG